MIKIKTQIKRKIFLFCFLLVIFSFFVISAEFSSNPSGDETIFTKGNLYKYDSSTDSWYKIEDLIPVHHWKLQEESGTNVNDAGSNPVNGSISGVTVNSIGIINKSFHFDGNDYVDINDSDSLYFEYNNFTIMTWVNFSSAENMMIFCHGDPTGPVNQNRWYFYLEGVGTTLLATDVFNGGSLDVGFRRSWTPNPNQWYLMTLRRNGNNWNYFVDGVQVGATLVDSDPVGNYIGPFTIGAESRRMTYLSGNMEDFRIYNKSLSEQEILMIYNEGRGTHSHSILRGYPTIKPPVHHWKMLDPNPAPLIDPVKINDAGKMPQTGTNYGAYSVPAHPGSLLRSLYFCSSDGEYIDVNPIINDWSNGISISFWMKRYYLSSYWYGAIIDFGNGAANNNILVKIDSNQKINFSIFNGASSNGGTASDSLRLDNIPDYWYFVTVTTNSSNNGKIYINGLLNKTGTVYKPNNINRANSYIGKSSDLSINTFNGWLEDVRVYDYPLSETEIENIYNSGRGLYE